KGRIEAVVKYVKYNFAKHRLFTTIQDFNKDCLAWLERTGNAKKHGTTKKIPAEVFRKEQSYLSPVSKRDYENHSKDSISRMVRKDNTILFSANRYTVPLGTYKPGRKVYVEKTKDNMLKIIIPETGEIIARHKISFKKGQLIQNNNHLRDHSQKIKKLYRTTLDLLGKSKDSEKFLKGIREDKPRYVRDQFSLIIKVSKDLSQSEIDKAVSYCLKHDFYSATFFRSVVENLNKLSGNDKKTHYMSQGIESPSYGHTEVRDLSEYEKYMR
ncbi:MAG: Mu transposase domain-containing protein, partial [Bacillota bacterium]